MNLEMLRRTQALNTDEILGNSKEDCNVLTEDINPTFNHDYLFTESPSSFHNMHETETITSKPIKFQNYQS